MYTNHNNRLFIVFYKQTYMCIWQRAMKKTILKIIKTTTILNNFSNCCQFYLSVLLKNGKIGPRP